MKKISRIIFYWAPAIIWMGVIFYLSSRVRVSLTKQFITDFIIFKTLHMVEYAILYFLLFRGFYSFKKEKLSWNKRMISALIISIIYAATDEMHQLSTPTRQGTVRDIIIDAAGATLMYIYIRAKLSLVKKYL